MARGEFYEVACVREALQGPVPSVTPQFFKSGEIDWKATGNVIEAMVAGGAKSLLVTNGDSLLTILTDKETMEFNRFVAPMGKCCWPAHGTGSPFCREAAPFIF